MVVMVAAVLLALATAGGGSSPASAQAGATGGVLLVDGTVFPGTLTSVSDDWIEIESNGVVMQLPWAAVRGDKLLSHRRRNIIPENIPSLQSFLSWCRQQGMNKEAGEAEVMLRRAGGSPERVPVSKAPERPDAPVVDNPSKPSTPGADKPTPPKEAPRKSTKRAAETWQLVSDAKKIPITDEVKEKLGGLKGKSATKNAEVKIELSDYVLTTVKRPTWMGSVVYVIRNGSIKVTLTWKDGTKETTTVETGDRRSNKNDEEVNKMVHDELVTDVWSWVRARVE